MNIARNRHRISICKKALKKVEKVRELVEKLLVTGKAVYGINTGFGELANRNIKPDDLPELQKRLILSHCTGVGGNLTNEQGRAVMVLRLNSLVRGHSGIRVVVLKQIEKMLNRSITPVIPSKGSVGASGDLVPLAHMANVLCGRGKCIYKGEIIDANIALKKENIPPLKLQAKEGLALINGTQFMCALGALACFETENLLKSAQIVGSMAIEGLRATDAFLDENIHLARPHPGQGIVAGNIQKLVKNSEMVSSHKDCTKVQDAYTLRCMPQILGASMDALSHVRKKITIEMNSTTDNPLIFQETGEVISQGNFHGQPLALGLDYLCIAIAEIGNWCERLIFRMVSPHLSGLPAFLVEDNGLNSGFMITQYTCASLVAENKVLCHPASCDSIPCSASQEDHVSMGATSATKCMEIIRNTEYIMAIGALVAAQTMEFRENEAGEGTLMAHGAIRKVSRALAQDRYIKDDIEKMVSIIRNGGFVEAVEEKIGLLKTEP